jgi:hypothetical protein
MSNPRPGEPHVQSPETSMAQAQAPIVSLVQDIKMNPFVPQVDPDETGRTWTKWKNELTRRFRFFRITETDQLDALHIYGGEHVRELIDSLITEPDGEQSFQDVLSKLDSYFDPLVNKDSARNK